MATKSITALGRFAGIVCTLFFGFYLLEGAAGQSASPLVISSFSAGLNHPSGWGVIYNTAITTNGDWLVLDYGDGALYEFPANGGAEVTLVPVGGFANGYGGNGYSNPGIAVDSDNTLYLEGNYGNCILRFPYDAAAKTWDGLATLSSSNPTSKCSAPYSFARYSLLNFNGVGYFQPWGIAVDANNNLVVGSQDGGNFMFSLVVNVTGSTAKPSNPVELLDGSKVRAISVAVDPWENVYFVEEPKATSNSTPLPGVFEIPAGSSKIASDANLTRVDPNLSNVTGVTTDAAGNLYISDSKAGVFMVPNAGGPQGTPNTSAAVLLTALPAQGSVSIDQKRQIMYVPTTAVQSNGQADVAEVKFDTAELGASAVGTPTSPAATVLYAFNGSVTPASFVIEEAGTTTPDFSIVSGGSCATGTTYPALDSCTLNVVMKPLSTGSVSAKLLMLDASNTILASTVLHGTGLAPAIQVAPAWESAIGGSLKTPSQVAVDAAGNSYVADAGLGQVLMYAAGSDTSAAPVFVGAGLTAPTGVAVDGAGDVFIADSGKVYEVPNTPSGLNAQGQLTLTSGLGANLRLAVDGLGNLYVADPANARVVELSNLGGTLGILGQSETFLTTGFTAPSDVAVDSSNNLYVIDGADLFELSNGAQTAVLNTLSNATGVAIDASGAVYLSSAGGTVRIPYVNGALNPPDQTSLGASVTNPMAVAIDSKNNVYLADATAENVHYVSASSSLNFGNVPLGQNPTLDATITNDGNAPLTVTGYASTNPVDYTAADLGCVSGSPLAPASTCEVGVTLAPGPGEQGALTGQIGIQSNAANSPVVVNATGVGAPLAASVTAVAVASTAQVVSVPVTVTVAPSSGSGTPTGSVTLSLNGHSIATGTLTNGSATFSLVLVPAGSQTFSAAYSGDRVFGRSTGSATANVAKSAITAINGPASPPKYVLNTTTGYIPTNGSAVPFEYNYQVQVTAAAGTPTGSVTFMEGSVAACNSAAGSPPATQPLDAKGNAAFPTDCLSVPVTTGYPPLVTPHTITPVYSGDANYLSYTGSPITFQVLRNPSVAITSSPASMTVPAGSSASANLTLTSVLGYGVVGAGVPLDNYTLPLTLGCDNLPPHATCSFSYPKPDPNVPNSVDVTQTTPGLATLTITTNAPAGTVQSEISQPAPFTCAVLFGAGFIGLFFGGKRGRKFRALMMICLVILGTAFVGITACATTNLSPSSVLNTPSGTYAVTITAQQVGSVVVQTPSGPVTVYGSQNEISLPFTINVTVQ